MSRHSCVTCVLLALLLPSTSFAEETRLPGPDGGASSTAPTAQLDREDKSARQGDWAAFVTALGGTTRAFEQLDADSAPAAATVEVGYFVADVLMIKGILGGTVLSSEGTTGWGFSAGAGADLHLGQPTAQLRPLVGLELRLGKYISTQSDSVFLNMSARAGAAYFFTRNFAVRLAAGVDAPVQLKNGVFGLQIVPFELALGIAL